MAETFILRTGVDCWVSPTRNGRFGDQRLYVYNTTNAYIFFNKPQLPEGTVITNAKLVAYPVPTAVATAVTLNVSRLTSAFDPNTLTWNNLPASGAQVGTITRQWAPSTGAPFEIDITTEVQAMVSGQPWFGWRLSSTGTNVEQALWGAQSATPIFVQITYTVPPTAPVDLYPNGNATVNLARPVLQWSVPGGNANIQMAYQIQVATNQAMTTGLYTSNEITSGTSMADLATIAPSFTALTSGQSRWWRVRIKNDMGVWSPYGVPAQFTYTAPPSLTINTPGASTSDPTPAVTWTFGTTIAAWQVFVETANVSTPGESLPANTQVHDSGIQYGSSTSYTLPPGVVRFASPQQYRIRVRIWPDGVQIVSVTGRPTYFDVTSTFAWVPSGIAAPVNIQATQFKPPMAWWQVRWEYTNATVPDYFIIRRLRNGVLQDTWVTPAATREGATTWYSWIDYGVQARADVIWEVMTYKAGTGTSTSNPTITKKIVNIMPTVALQADPGNRRFVMVNASIKANLMEQSDVVTPVVGSPILVNWSYGRLMGTCSGTISWDAPLDTAWAINAQNMFDDFMYMRQNPKVIFVWQDQAIDAYMYNCTYESVGRADGKTDWVVSFDFFQTDA